MEQEAWLEGALEGFAPLLMPAAHALVQAKRDIERATTKLSNEELWHKPNNAPSVGFHLLHIAGSIDRLLTYARGETLSDKQFAFLAAEQEKHSADAQELTKEVVAAIETALEVIRAAPENTLFERRTVGRQRLPTTVFGLLFHIAEHTQRHTGQLVATAKIVSAEGLPAAESNL